VPTKDHDVPALEALFPKRILGLDVATRSYTLATLPEGFPLQLATIGRFFEKSAREVGVGLAVVPGNIVEMVAVRVPGASPDRLIDAFFIALRIPQVTPAETIAGKQVHAVRSADAIVGYLYAKGDVVFWVTGQRQRFAEDAIRQLP
jgi:hypothetical protein